MANTGVYTHFEKKLKLLKNNGTYSATFTVVKHPLPLLLLEQPANVHWFDVRFRTAPTKSHPRKFNYCDLFFTMPSALAKFAEVHAKHDSIVLIYNTSCHAEQAVDFILRSHL